MIFPGPPITDDANWNDLYAELGECCRTYGISFLGLYLARRPMIFKCTLTSFFFSVVPVRCYRG